jgi:hypothetical protein
MSTDYRNDCQAIFTHDNRSMDPIDFLPPVGEFLDCDYQALANQRMDFIGGQVSTPQTYREVIDQRMEFILSQMCGVDCMVDEDFHEFLYSPVALPVYESYSAYPKEENIIDFGEGWIGVGKHTSQMSGLDRMIFEDCHNGSGNIQRQGMNVPQIPIMHRTEYIANLCKCSFDQAEDLIDFWKIIDESNKLFPTFISWTQKRGVEPALDYFESMAGALVDDDCHVNDRQMGNGKPWSNVEADFDQDSMVSILESGDEFAYKIDSLEALEEVWEQLTLPHESNETGFMPHEIEAIFERYEHGRFPTPDLLRYARMNHQDDPISTVPAIDPYTGQRTYSTFMERQPEWFVKLIAFIKKANLRQINELRKRGFGHPKLKDATKYQRRMFWSMTKTRQSILNVRKMAYINKLLANLNNAEQHSLTMIRNCKNVKQAKYYWYLIYGALNGEQYMGRKGFVEYVLKPELHKRQESLLEKAA